MTGCWFSRHSSLGLRTVRIVASWPSGTKPIPAGAALAGPRPRACRRQADRQQAQVFAVVPHPVGVADADLGHAVLLGDRAGHLAVERGVELGLDVELGEADPGRLHAVGPDDDVGVAQVDVGVHVGHAFDFLDDLADLFGQLAECREVGAEDLDLDRAVDARQVVDLVLHQRDELGLQLGDLGLELLAEGVEELVHRPALAGRLEAHEDVAGIRLGREEAELGPGPADVARDVGRLQEHVLDPAHDLVGLGQRGADRHVVVEHERPFVHVGHEAGFQVRGQPPERERPPAATGARRDREPEPDLEQPLVAVGQQVVDRAGASASAGGPGTGRRAPG